MSLNGEGEPSEPRSGLWVVKELASYLRRSERWVRSRLTLDPKHAGSIPSLRGPGLGRGARFDPAEIKEWLAQGCPPAAEFRARRSARKGTR